MKRISPKAVVDAYIATGMYPVFRKWGTLDKQGGCALTTIGTSCGCYKHPCSSGRKIVHYSGKLGCSADYLNGLVRGFDGRCFLGSTFNIASIEEFVQGQRDGWDARAAVKAHFAKAKRESTPKVASEQLVTA